jgi:hypothetical protein
VPLSECGILRFAFSSEPDYVWFNFPIHIIILRLVLKNIINWFVARLLSIKKWNWLKELGRREYLKLQEEQKVVSL